MSIVNAETGELIEPMDADAARRLTERIRIAATNYTEAKAKVLALVDEAKAGSAHIALGYKSWTAYLSDVLSDEPLRLARDERRELVTRLADEGMSSRAIAPIVGVSDRQVRTDIEVGTDFPVEPATVVRTTTGLDGRERTTATSGALTKPKRRPITDVARDTGWELRRVVEKLERLAADDRFNPNKTEVAPHLRGHLEYATEVLADLLGRINNN